MKNSRKALLAIIASSLIVFSGCGTVPEAKEDTKVQNNITSDVYKAQIEYYMQTVNSLQSEILKEKEMNYIAECEYRLQIAELEKSVAALSAQIEAITVNGTATLSPLSDKTAFTDKNESSSQNHTQASYADRDAKFDYLNASSDFTYSKKNREITVTAYTGNKINVVVPKVIDGFEVTAIGESAFSGCNIETVILQEGIKIIDWFAFKDCKGLKEITLPSSLSSIGYGAFESCSKDLTVICEKNSYAEKYAASWGIAYKSN